MEQNHDMDEIDLLELARLLWSHALQIAAAGIAAAVICLLVCTFVLTPRYQLVILDRSFRSGRTQCFHYQ